MKKKIYYIMFSLFFVMCASRTNKTNSDNVILKKELKEVINLYLNYNGNRHLNHKRYYISLGIEKIPNGITRIYLANEFRYSDSIPNNFYGRTTYKNYQILVSGDFNQELLSIDKSKKILQKEYSGVILLESNPLQWKIDLDQKLRIIRFKDNVGGTTIPTMYKNL